MSFLNNVRIVFNGRFHADVSTVNNDVRHFDNRTFEASFQEFQSQSGAWNGWWNPPGSGAFRFPRVSGWLRHYRDGTSGTSDPVAIRRRSSEPSSGSSAIKVRAMVFPTPGTDARSFSFSTQTVDPRM
jgi:hypothetical protein